MLWGCGGVAVGLRWVAVTLRCLGVTLRWGLVAGCGLLWARCGVAVKRVRKLEKTEQTVTPFTQKYFLVKSGGGGVAVGSGWLRRSCGCFWWGSRGVAVGLLWVAVGLRWVGVTLRWGCGGVVVGGCGLV